MIREGLLLFHGSEGSAMRIPVDLKLFQLATQFAREQLAKPLDLALAGTVMLVYRTEIHEGQEVPVEILAMGGLQQIVDCFLFRTKQGKFSGQATRRLWTRLNNLLSDRGLQGQEILLHIASEPEDRRCPQADEWLLAAKAEPADRMKVVIR